MSKDLGADWGIPYYNKPKPPDFNAKQCNSRIASIERQIRILQQEKENLINLLNE